MSRTQGKNIAQTALINCLNAYKAIISPYTIKSCRYYPSCSDYAKEAIIRYGAITGAKKAIIRLLKCHPFSPGGYDPVDEALTDKG